MWPARLDPTQEPVRSPARRALPTARARVWGARLVTPSYSPCTDAAAEHIAVQTRPEQLGGAWPLARLRVNIWADVIPAPLNAESIRVFNGIFSSMNEGENVNTAQQTTPD